MKYIKLTVLAMLFGVLSGLVSMKFGFVSEADIIYAQLVAVFWYTEHYNEVWLGIRWFLDFILALLVIGTLVNIYHTKNESA